MFSNFKRRLVSLSSILVVAIALSFVAINQANALVICDDASSTPFISTANANIQKNINNFDTQEGNYINKSYDAIYYLIKKRLMEFRKNTINWFSDWVVNRLQPAMKDMMQQFSVNYMEQVMIISKVIDAKQIIEHYQNADEMRISSQQRYEPSVSAGMLDTFGPSLTKGYQASKAVSRSLMRSQMDSYSNTKGSLSAGGKVATFGTVWDDYKNYFCDSSKGDIGCDGVTPDPEIAGRNRDIGSVLWGQAQTLDISDKKNRLILDYAARFIAYPDVSEVIVPGTDITLPMKEEMLKRRAAKARNNVAYFALTQMLGERVSGAGSAASTYINEVREAADVNPDKIAPNPSYREISETLNRDRFYMPDYFVSLASNNIPQLMREQVAIGANRLQLMDDMYRRQEELLLIEAADYSRDMDFREPSIAMDALSLVDPNGN